MHLPMYIPGYSASMIKPLIEDDGLSKVILVDDDWSTYTKASYSSYLTDTFSENLLVNKVSNCPYCEAVSDVGFYMKIDNIPTYTGYSWNTKEDIEYILSQTKLNNIALCYSIKNIKKPKKIHIHCIARQYSGYYILFALKFIGQKTGNVYYPVIITDGTSIINNNNEFYFLDNNTQRYAFTNTLTINQTFDVSVDLPNCFLDNELYTLEYISPYQHTSAGYNMSAVCFQKLIIEA